MHVGDLLIELRHVPEPTRALVLETADGRVLPVRKIVESSTLDECGDGNGILFLLLGPADEAGTPFTVEQLIADLDQWEKTRQIMAEAPAETFLLEYSKLELRGTSAILAAEPN